MAESKDKKKSSIENDSWLQSFISRLTLGTGTAESARRDLASRHEQIDALLSEASVGTTSREGKKKKDSKK